VGIGNAGGGWLIVGVSDRVPRKMIAFKVPSTDEIAKIEESVADAAQIHVNVEIISTSDGPVLTIGIPRRPRR
jgi:hypothetical protein